jgi:hypothetical protein
MSQSIFQTLALIFKEYNVRCVLIGGYAVNAHKVTRHTVDVDFLITREDFNKVLTSLNNLGYKIIHEQETFLQLACVGFRDIDFMLSDTATLKKIFDTGDRVVIADEEFITPNLMNLIALKLHSVKWNRHRELIDIPDIILLLQANDITIESPDIKIVFEKYGTPELFRMVQEGIKK